MGKADSLPKVQCTAELIQIGLFFCLWSCEYTKTVSCRHTTQLRFWYMQFHNDTGVIPGVTPDQTFLDSWATTLFLDTQENCVRGESISIEANSLQHGNTVSISSQRFLHLRTNGTNSDTPIYMYYTTPGSNPSSILSHHIRDTLCVVTQKLAVHISCKLELFRIRYGFNYILAWNLYFVILKLRTVLFFVE